MKISEKRIVELIREEFTNRLLQLEVAAKLAESEVTDSRGNVLISKDLKVRHVDSGYEYTVDHIEGEGEEMQIYLRKPEVPRVEVPLVAKRMHEIENSVPADIISNEDTDGSSLMPDENQGQQDLFVVNAQDFEKEYIVD
ncbi:MAG: hypothetical protein CBB97_07005 [Candidatus Endolissoclinum sp. TMED37]|nr:MAG: hypothetical protein CBB97_07005 [Candidatus Endolissoclinum sp. TMED37]|tara:strand:- start:973 stop:1392 length:420 start_codon:yes stop_codon:yes gene_type:complete